MSLYNFIRHIESVCCCPAEIITLDHMHLLLCLKTDGGMFRTMFTLDHSAHDPKYEISNKINQFALWFSKCLQ